MLVVKCVAVKWWWVALLRLAQKRNCTISLKPLPHSTHHLQCQAHLHYNDDSQGDDEEDDEGKAGLLVIAFMLDLGSESNLPTPPSLPTLAPCPCAPDKEVGQNPTDARLAITQGNVKDII